MSVGHKIEKDPDGRWAWQIVNINLDGSEEKKISSETTFLTEKEAADDIERYCTKTGVTLAP